MYIVLTFFFCRLFLLWSLLHWH